VDLEFSRAYCLLLLYNLLLCLCSLPESVLELASHGLHVTHASSSFSTTALGLFSPIVLTHFLGGVSARRARRLLKVERRLTASTADDVRLIVSLSE
jgi:hypothetical protein